jgi:hypothetical protein
MYLAPYHVAIDAETLAVSIRPAGKIRLKAATSIKSYRYDTDLYEQYLSGWLPKRGGDVNTTNARMRNLH